MKRIITRFALIGSGNVATHLSLSLSRGGMICTGVFSRTLSHASILAKKLDTVAYETLTRFSEAITAEKTEILIISVSDDAISEIASSLPPTFPIPVVHTSGSTSLDALREMTHRGVFYPMQTFSIEREVDFSRVPVFVEYSTRETKDTLMGLVAALGVREVRTITSEERLRLHLAAVFGCNFVNHLYALTTECLRGTNIPFTALTPLLEETLTKALSHDPRSVQTGPAIRHDEKTITKHLALLQDDSPKLAEVYRFLTHSIQDFSTPNQ